jgi:hypothetical protein
MDQLHRRDRMPKKPMPAAERRQETEMRSIIPPWSSRITGRIPGGETRPGAKARPRGQVSL